MAHKEQTILAIDQAASVSGWSLWHNQKPVMWGTVQPIPRSAKGGQRLTSIRNQFEDLIITHKPDKVLIEDPVGGEEDKSGPESNWKTMQTLCQVQGVLIELVNRHNIPIEIISPSSWQYTCGIHKRARFERKAGARNFVEQTYNIKDVQDIIDSICIGHHYLYSTRSERSAF